VDLEAAVVAVKVKPAARSMSTKSTLH